MRSCWSAWCVTDLTSNLRAVYACVVVMRKTCGCFWLRSVNAHTWWSRDVACGKSFVSAPLGDSDVFPRFGTTKMRS